MSSEKADETVVAASAATEPEDDEEDLEKLQAEIAKMEEEAARIAQETEDLEKEKQAKANISSGAASASGASASTSSNNGVGGKADGKASGEGDGDAIKRDGFSVYVGQVEYSATPEELLAHFEPCGTVERVTIVCDKYTGHPKGFAYLEFQTDEAVENALKLDGSTFKDRQLKVTHKRVNDPNYHFQNAGGPGAGGRGYRGGYRGGGRGYRGGYRGGGRGGYRGRGYRGGRGGGYHPYH